MVGYLKKLYQYRELLWVWTLRNIQVRYKQSLLGGLWAVLQPLSLMIAFSVIFTQLVKVSTDGTPYPVFAYTALLPWTFFAVSITFGITSLTSNLNLVTKISFPREILPLASIGAAFVDLLVGSTVFIGMLLYYGIPIRNTVWVLPILLLVQILLTIGIVLFSSAVNVFYHDVQYVVPLAIQLLMYATPVIYPASQVPIRWRGIYMLNPMATLIESYRAVILQGRWPEWQSLLIASIISLAIFMAGYLYFKNEEWQFADII